MRACTGPERCRTAGRTSAERRWSAREGRCAQQPQEFVCASSRKTRAPRRGWRAVHCRRRERRIHGHVHQAASRVILTNASASPVRRTSSSRQVCVGGQQPPHDGLGHRRSRYRASAARGSRWSRPASRGSPPPPGLLMQRMRRRTPCARISSTLPLADDAAAHQHDDALGERLGLLQVVRGEQDRAAARVSIADHASTATRAPRGRARWSAHRETAAAGCRRWRAQTARVAAARRRAWRTAATAAPMPVRAAISASGRGCG